MTRGVVILALALLAGVGAAHWDARLRKPLLTPLALCTAAYAMGTIAVAWGRGRSVRRENAIPSSKRVTAIVGALAAAVCLTAFLGEGWRVYRDAVLSVPAPVDQLADAARASAWTPSDGDHEAEKRVAELKAGLARREELQRERGSLIDHTRFRWRNFEGVLPLSGARSVTMLLLGGECLVAFLAGVLIGETLVRPRTASTAPECKLSASSDKSRP